MHACPAYVLRAHLIIIDDQMEQLHASDCLDRSISCARMRSMSIPCTPCSCFSDAMRCATCAAVAALRGISLCTSACAAFAASAVSLALRCAAAKSSDFTSRSERAASRASRKASLRPMHASASTCIACSWSFAASAPSASCASFAREPATERLSSSILSRALATKVRSALASFCK